MLCVGISYAYINTNKHMYVLTKGINNYVCEYVSGLWSTFMRQLMNSKSLKNELSSSQPTRTLQGISCRSTNNAIYTGSTYVGKTGWKCEMWAHSSNVWQTSKLPRLVDRWSTTTNQTQRHCAECDKQKRIRKSGRQKRFL